MAVIDQSIADFIKDAQFRIAEIGTDLDGMEDFESPRYIELESFRLELYQFMDILYIGQWSIIDDYNHLDWEDYDIQREIEYLRNRTQMINSPYTTFVGNYPEIIETINDSVKLSLPLGTFNDVIYYDENGNAVTSPFPNVAGMNATDTPLTYFN